MIDNGKAKMKEFLIWKKPDLVQRSVGRYRKFRFQKISEIDGRITTKRIIKEE